MPVLGEKPASSLKKISAENVQDKDWKQRFWISAWKQGGGLLRCLRIKAGEQSNDFVRGGAFSDRKGGVAGAGLQSQNI